MIVKHGDVQPINSIMDEDKPVMCQSCGQPKTVIAMNDLTPRCKCEGLEDDNVD